MRIMLANTLGASRFLGSRRSDVQSHFHAAVNRNVVIRVQSTERMQNNTQKYVYAKYLQQNKHKNRRSYLEQPQNFAHDARIRAINIADYCQLADPHHATLQLYPPCAPPKPISSRVFLISRKSVERHCCETHSSL